MSKNLKQLKHNEKVYGATKQLTHILVSFIACGILMSAAAVGAVYFYDSPTTRILVKCAMIPIVGIFLFPTSIALIGIIIGEERLFTNIHDITGYDMVQEHEEDQPEKEEVQNPSPAQNTRSKTKIPDARNKSKGKKEQKKIKN